MGGVLLSWTAFPVKIWSSTPPLSTLIDLYGENVSVIKIRPNLQICEIRKFRILPKLEQFHLGINKLTHWGRDRMATISQTMFANAFSWMKMHEFRLRFHQSLFLRFQLTIFHYLNQWWLVNWRIYASIGLSELIPSGAWVIPVRCSTMNQVMACYFMAPSHHLPNVDLWSICNSLIQLKLTDWGQVTQICVSKTNHHWFR